MIGCPSAGSTRHPSVTRSSVASFSRGTKRPAPSSSRWPIAALVSCEGEPPKSTPVTISPLGNCFSVAPGRDDHAIEQPPVRPRMGEQPGRVLHRHGESQHGGKRRQFDTGGEHDRVHFDGVAADPHATDVRAVHVEPRHGGGMTDDGAVRRRGLEQQPGRGHRIDRRLLVAEAGSGHRSWFQRGDQAAQFRLVHQAAAVAPRLLRDHAAAQRLGPLRLALPLHRAAPLHDQARRPELILQAAPASHAEVIQFVVTTRPFRAGVDPGKRVRRGASGRRALLEQVYIRSALGQVIRDRRTHDAAADDHDAPRRPRRQPRWPTRPGPRR